MRRKGTAHISIKTSKQSSAVRAFTIVAVLSFIVGFLYTQNNWLQTTFYDMDIISESLNHEDRTDRADITDETDVTDGDLHGSIRIVHLSDLHGKSFGKSNRRLLTRVDNLGPDIIVVTGDWIDQNSGDIDVPALTLNKLKDIAPLFYIPGNHEYWYSDIEDWEHKLDEARVTMMHNEISTINIRGLQINILGLDEAMAGAGTDDSNAAFSALGEMGGYKILLGHYPENFAMLDEDSYQFRDFDLMLSGHAHGGQVILPLIGGVISPGEGFNPIYYKGMFAGLEVSGSERITRMLVSRGLGNSIIPQRLFNRPEIVVIDLHR